MGPSTPPGGFVEERRAGARMILRADLAATLLEAGVEDPAALVSRGRTLATFRGRGRAILLELPGGGPRVVVREYRHGGLLGTVLGGLFLFGDRAASETAALVAADEAGILVARPVAAVRRRAGPLYRAHLVTEAVEDADDLVARLTARGDGAETLDAAPVLEAAGRSMRRLHEAGIVVHDLHVKNVLVSRSDAARATLVDFDRARVLGHPVPPARRLRDLFRMDRSLEKLARSGVPVARRERARLFRGYRNGDRIPVDERRDACRRYRRHLALHRLSWLLRGR